MLGLTGQDRVSVTTRQARTLFKVKHVSTLVYRLRNLGVPVYTNRVTTSRGVEAFAERSGTPSYMVDNADELRPEWVAGKKRVGVTAGASAPEVLVQEVVARLRELGATEVSELDGITERVTFPLPKNLVTS